MRGKLSGYIIKLIISLLLILCFSRTAFPFQKNISGNTTNIYAQVVTIGPAGSDRVFVNDATGFAAGDTILLIQMQGVGILTSPYGTVQTKFGEPGLYEFLIIQSVVSATEIIFRNNILKTYDIKGNVQIVRVPYYNSANVSGILSSLPWSNSTKTGGVLALIVGRSLKLSANIDVSGKGFKGGNDAIGQGRGMGPNAIEAYPLDSLNAGFKGEGLAIHNDAGILLYPLYVKGMGPNFTGGGGGNGKYSGGGGGSNRGAGGVGGFENYFPPSVGGIGGKKADHALLTDRIYLGGGGGASTSLTGLSAPGGNGGGIVMIVTDTIISNGGKIIASGNDVPAAAANAGSGGGGAGGSVALSLRSYSSIPLQILVGGGKGGDNPGAFGEGGGGGGGLLWISTNLTANVTPVLAGGLSGNSLNPSASDGDIGELRPNFKVILNGFLFNSIRSSVTGDQIDSVCSTVIPKRITGTMPLGGTPPYNYLWEKSYDLVTWTFLYSGTDSVNYTPNVLETDTVYFRRTITDASIPALTDFSKLVKIVVQPFIKDNVIGVTDTICYNQIPLPLKKVLNIRDGNGRYSYIWESSPDNSLWNNAANRIDTAGYQPPALISSTYFRRYVTSGRCVNASNSVRIQVLDTISKNIITTPSDTICHGGVFDNLNTDPALGGGDGIYRYLWQSSLNGSTWGTAAGVVNLANYDPVESSPSFPGKEYYRRIVSSGIHDVCVNTGKPVVMVDWPVITNNSIASGQTICSGSTPSKITGSLPANGNGIYKYTWQDSTKTHSWTDIPGFINGTSIDYQPPSLTDTTRYRRIVFSSACNNISKSLIINVHRPVLNNNISLISASGTDTTICNGATPNLLKGALASGGTNIPGSYVYEWNYSIDNTNWNPVTSGGAGVNYQPAALSATTWYKRKATSGSCLTESNVIKIIVLPFITNNTISTDQTICYNTLPAQLTGIVLSGGAGAGTYLYLWEESPDGTIWSPATGTNNSANYQPPALTALKKYKRIVRSGFNDCCTSISNIISIGINQLPTGAITTINDTTICEGSKVPLKFHLTGASKWRMVYKENTSQVNLNIQGADTTILVQPSLIASTGIFNYSLYSVQDKNNCSATSITGSRNVTVYKVPQSVAGSAAEVCGPVYTLTASPSVGTGKWLYPAGVVDTTANGAVVTVKVDSTATASQTKYKFIWKEANWKCIDKDSVIITFSKRIGAINAGPDRDLYSFEGVDTLRAARLLVGTGTWSVISGTGVIENDSIVRQLSQGENKFEWAVTNGSCLTKDQVTITVYELKIPEGFSPNNDMINDEFVIQGLNSAYNEASLKIFNSAGSVVFSTDNLNENIWTNWNGQGPNGILPEGTYYYLLTVKSKRNDSAFKKSGFILLKRY
jgi:gliding motility-associated-like protein